jgi:folate-binding protein YgfZ
MTDFASYAPLPSRAVIALGGPGWREFLQGLITQDALSLADGECRLGALLTPQGRLLHDLFLIGRGDDALIDCAAEARDDLLDRLVMYRLRAKAEIAKAEIPVIALWGVASAPAGFSRDLRAPGLGFRGYGATPPAEARATDEAAYDAHRLAQGVPGPADWAGWPTYPIEANFDLLHGIDFRKGCFIGQETTSRMKRRGAIRNRLAPIAFDGPAPAPGAELLAGTLRAGEVRSVQGQAAMALLRVDRLESGPLRFGADQTWRPVWPDWLPREAVPPSGDDGA